MIEEEFSILFSIALNVFKILPLVERKVLGNFCLRRVSWQSVWIARIRSKKNTLWQSNITNFQPGRHKKNEQKQSIRIFSELSLLYILQFIWVIYYWKKNELYFMIFFTFISYFNNISLKVCTYNQTLSIWREHVITFLYRWKSWNNNDNLVTKFL